MSQDIRELIETIVKAIVDNPDQVSVKELEGERVCIYEIKVADNDAGKVIGKQGQTAKAIRTIVSAAAVKKNKRAEIEIIEPQGL